MKKIFTLLFYLYLISSFSFSQKTGFISTKGKDIITPDGKPLFLKGINLGNWLVPEGYMFKFDSANSPRLINKVISELVGPDEAKKFWSKFRDNYILKEDIEYIKKLGLNSIRLPFNWKLFVLEEYPEVMMGPGFDMLDRAIKWCKEFGIYIILDMHCAPGGQTGDNIDDSWGYSFLFDSEESQKTTIEIWKKIAEKYQNEKIIIGYDLLNEPIAPFTDTSKFNSRLEPLYKRITNAIREVDKNHLIFLGGAQWNQNFSNFGAPFDDKLVYTFHMYWSDTTKEVIQKFLDLREKFNFPIWMGESGENTDMWIYSFRSLLERNNIGWCFWPYKKISSKSSLVSIVKPNGYDKIIEFANKPRATFRELREIRPPFDFSKMILDQLLENCKYKNCIINEGYVKALGLNYSR